MKVTNEMIERGARALWKSSVYHGYNEETLEREWDRMCNIWRRQVAQILEAALQQTPGARREQRPTENSQIGSP